MPAMPRAVHPGPVASRRPCAALFVGAAFAVALSMAPHSAPAGVSFEFLKIADSLTEQPGNPGVNFGYFASHRLFVADGEVLFLGDGGGFSDAVSGAYRWSPATGLSIVTDDSDPVYGGSTAFSTPTKNGDDVFLRALRTGSLHRVRNGVVETVLSPGHPTTDGATVEGFSDYRAAGGTIVFEAIDSNGDYAFFKAPISGGPAERLFQGEGAFPGIPTDPAAATFEDFDGQHIPFKVESTGVGGSNDSAIYTSDLDGNLTILAKTGDAMPGSGLPFRSVKAGSIYPSIDDGIVAFPASIGSAPEAGIYTAPAAGGPLTLIADTVVTQLPNASPNILTLNSASISDGNVAFLGTRQSGGGEQLFLSWESTLYSVLRTGDEFDGGIVGNVLMSTESIDGDLLAFWVAFEGGRTGVYAARVVPAPPAAAALVSALSLLAKRRRAASSS